jgi:glycine/D-amino acid oxidase-like deaminating enzyme
MGTEVLVVGGGLIGTSIAWRLAQQGARVTIADAGSLGGEASPAGAGMLSPGAEGREHRRVLELGVESLKLYPRFVEELRSATGMEIDFRVTGCLLLDAAAHEPAGIRVERRPDGLFYPDDALVDPEHLLRALRCAAEAQGVRMENRVVTNLEASVYGAVVVAAGAWSSQLRLTYHDRAVSLPESIPVKGHLIGFRMPPGLLGPFLRRGAAYVLQRANGLVVAGSNEERAGFDTSVHPLVCERLHQDAARLLPELEREQPVRRWIGFRPDAANGPLMGRVEGTNVWLAYGHYRNGILLTPLTAERIAASVLQDV